MKTQSNKLHIPTTSTYNELMQRIIANSFAPVVKNTRSTARKVLIYKSVRT